MKFCKMDLNSSDEEIELMAQNNSEDLADSFLEKDVEKSMSVKNPFVMSMKFNPIWRYCRAGGSSVKVTVSRKRPNSENSSKPKYSSAKSKKTPKLELEDAAKADLPAPNVELKAILRMVSNRYDKNSHPPYIVYFAKLKNDKTERYNNIFCAIENQHTDHSQLNLQDGVILMEFTNYSTANGVIENFKELRQLGWIGFIPSLKISRTVIINNVDKNLPVRDAFNAIQTTRYTKILNIERIKRQNCDTVEPTNLITVTFKDPIIPDKLEINGQSCFVKRYIRKIADCSYCEKYEQVNEGCRIFWEKMWKSHCKSNFSVEFECPICEGAKKEYNDADYQKRLKGAEIQQIRRVLKVTQTEALQLQKSFLEAEKILTAEYEKELGNFYDTQQMLDTVKEISEGLDQRDLEYLRDLHMNGVNLNCTLNQLNQTPLHLAILGNAPLNLIKMLLDCGLDMNAEDIFCQTPLYLAITGGDEKILDGFVNMNYSHEKNWPYKYQISEDGLALIKLLLRYGANVNPQKGSLKRSQSPSIFEEVIKELELAKELEGYSPITLLHLVAFIGDNDVFELLMYYGADFDSWHSLFGSPIFMAVFLGHEKIVETLLKYRADVLRPLGADAMVSPVDILENMSLLHLATKSGHERLVKMLVEYMLENSPVDLDGDNFVHQLIKFPARNFEMSEEFKEEVNFKELYCNFGPPKTTILIKEKGIKVPSYKPEKKYGIVDYIMCMFLKNNLDINHKNKKGMSPLDVAAEKGMENPYVKLLMRFGADINAKNSHGRTALHTVLKHSSRISNEGEWNIGNIMKYAPDFSVLDHNGRTPVLYVGVAFFKVAIRQAQQRRAFILQEILGKDPQQTYGRHDERCIQNEIERMKETPVTLVPYCSLYNFLRLPRHKLGAVLRNQCLSFNYRNVEDAMKFRVCFPVVKEKFKQGETVVQLEARFIKAFNRLIDKEEFSEFVAEEISKYLTLDEIRNTITASSLSI